MLVAMAVEVLEVVVVVVLVVMVVVAAAAVAVTAVMNAVQLRWLNEELHRDEHEAFRSCQRRRSGGNHIVVEVVYIDGGF